MYKHVSTALVAYHAFSQQKDEPRACTKHNNSVDSPLPIIMGRHVGRSRGCQTCRNRRIKVILVTAIITPRFSAKALCSAMRGRQSAHNAFALASHALDHYRVLFLLTQIRRLLEARTSLVLYSSVN